MQFFDAVRIVFKKYADFRGTATRPEYWWWFLFSYIISLIAGSFDMAFKQGAVSPIQVAVSFALFLPNLAVMVRRNRDAGFSAWWLTLWVLPIVALFIGVFANRDAMSNFYTSVDGDATISDTQAVQLWMQLLPVFGPMLLALAAVGIFFFVVSLLPSKKKQQPVVATIDY